MNKIMWENGFREQESGIVCTQSQSPTSQQYVSKIVSTFPQGLMLVLLYIPINNRFPSLVDEFVSLATETVVQQICNKKWQRCSLLAESAKIGT